MGIGLFCVDMTGTERSSLVFMKILKTDFSFMTAIFALLEKLDKSFRDIKLCKTSSY